MSPKKSPRPINFCEYIKNQHGFISGCGFRAAYNKHWKYCPYCGKLVASMMKTKDIENT